MKRKRHNPEIRDRRSTIPQPLNSVATDWSRPTEEALEHTKERQAAEWNGLSEVAESVRVRFSLHKCAILPQRDVNFRTYIFVDRDKDLQPLHNAGIDREIEDFVYAELERVGRGLRNAITIAFEYDSYENVRKRFGNYYNRLL